MACGHENSRMWHVIVPEAAKKKDKREIVNNAI